MYTIETDYNNLAYVIIMTMSERGYFWTCDSEDIVNVANFLRTGDYLNLGNWFLQGTEIAQIAMGRGVIVPGYDFLS